MRSVYRRGDVRAPGTARFRGRATAERVDHQCHHDQAEGQRHRQDLATHPALRDHPLALACMRRAEHKEPRNLPVSNLKVGKTGYRILFYVIHLRGIYNRIIFYVDIWH